MGFADTYFARFKTQNITFDEPVNGATGLTVIIPCYDEAGIFDTLTSLNNATPTSCHVEVIVAVNSAENTPTEIVQRNRLIFNELQARRKEFCFTLLPCLLERVDRRHAGVGHARKVAMDAALRRYNIAGKPRGIIVSLDADCSVDKNYFAAINDFYQRNPKSGGCVFQFQHDFDDQKYPPEIIAACKQYELYLRYFRNSLIYSGFAYPLHTIGSCFSVVAVDYAKVGGMPQRQGGEDFYFLHKLAPTTTVGCIARPLVFPSPRISTRVPFGTGPAVKSIIEQQRLMVYNFELFKILKSFFGSFVGFFRSSDIRCVPDEVKNYFTPALLLSVIDECRSNVATPAAFVKRLFRTFDAFAVIKFLNSFNSDSKFGPTTVQTAVRSLLEALGRGSSSLSDEMLYNRLLQIDLEM